MNISRAITDIKMRLQLNNITLPLKDDVSGQIMPTENIIREVLVNMTIPTYSQFVPWKRSAVHSLTKMDCIDKDTSLYRLPKELTITPVLYVINIELPHTNTRASIGDYTPTYAINRSIQGVATSMAYQMAASQLRHEPTWELGEGDTIHMYGWPRIPLKFTVACEHMPNGETIPHGCYDSFMELAILDMKIFVYNTLKYYDGLPSAHGQINLGIQDWSSADADRNTLLDRWRDTFHLDMGWESWM